MTRLPNPPFIPDADIDELASKHMADPSALRLFLRSYRDNGYDTRGAYFRVMQRYDLCRSAVDELAQRLQSRLTDEQRNMLERHSIRAESIRSPKPVVVREHERQGKIVREHTRNQNPARKPAQWNSTDGDFRCNRCRANWD